MAIVEPRKIEKYQTSDGQYFDDFRVALEHERFLDFKGWCEEHINRGGESDATTVAENIWEEFNVSRKSKKGNKS